MFHNMDDIMFSFWGKLFRRSIFYAEDISSKLDRHNLRTQTNAQIWNHIFTSILCSDDHPFNSPISKSSRDTDTIEPRENSYTTFFNLFCFDKNNFYLFLMTKSSCLQSSIQRIISIFESNIFSYHTNSDNLL